MELMIVIIILGLLAAMVMPQIVGRGEQAKRKIACVSLKTISDGLKSFKMDLGKFPTIEEGLMSLVKNPDPEKYKHYQKGGYFDGKKEPKDPWGNSYIYIIEDNEFSLMSLGADGKEGGKDEDEDIVFPKCQE